MKQTRTLFGVLAALVLISAGAISFHYMLRGQEEAQERFFADALKQAAVIEHVRIGNDSYDVLFGNVQKNDIRVTGEEALRVLKFAYSKTVARRAPFFSLEGTDTVRLSLAIDELNNT